MTQPMAFALVSDEDGSELTTAAGVDGFFVPPARTVQTWRTFDLLGCQPVKRGQMGNVELCVLDDAGAMIGSYFIANCVLETPRPSAVADGLSDVSATGLLLSQPDPMAGPVWRQWRSGPPSEPNLWATFDGAGRTGWLEVVRMYKARGYKDQRGMTVVVDGRFATDLPGMYLALGEAINGPGGYFGASLDSLADCLRGGFGAAVPFTMTWMSAETARETVGREPLLPGVEVSDWDAMLTVLAEAGVTVTLQ